jgi:hypothetical protein
VRKLKGKRYEPTEPLFIRVLDAIAIACMNGIHRYYECKARAWREVSIEIDSSFYRRG